MKAFTVIGLLLLGSLSSIAWGVEVAFEQDDRLPLVYFNLAVRGGAVTDPQGQAGLTNFMGEMLLRGTKSRTKEQLDLALDQIGAVLEVETRSETLILRGAVLTAQLDPFLEIVRDIVTRPSFPEAEIRKLKAETTSQILEELGKDQALAARRFGRFLFQDHPYGKPILGTISEVQKLTQAQLLDHYERLFRDKHLLLVGAGQAPLARLQSWADGIARDRPSAPTDTTEAKPLAPPSNGPVRRLLLVDKPARTQTQIDVGQIGVQLNDPRHFPLYLANYVFGGPTFSSRLMTEVRVKRGWSYGANSAFRYGLQPRSWNAHLFPASKDAPQALALVLGMIEELKRNGITDAEFDFARNSIINGAGFMYDTPQKRVENKLVERTLNLPDGFFQSYAARIAELRLSDVNAALNSFFLPEQMTIAVVGTAKELKEPLAKAAAIPTDRIQVRSYTEEE